MLAIIIFLVVHWYVSAFCQSFFLHRYGAHAMFTMPRFWDRFFYFLTYVSQGSSFLNPRAYALLHRYTHLGWYLSRMPPQDGVESLDDLAAQWWSFA